MVPLGFMAEKSTMWRNLFFLKKNRKSKQRFLRNKKIIEASGFFDADWYVRAYPDAIGFPGGPLAHFLEVGVAEGRAAGPRFDTRAYLNANPDVAASGFNPLVHYIELGLGEGRTFAPDPRPSARPGKAEPVSFSLICADGDPADLRATFRSLAVQSGVFFELVLGPAGAAAADTVEGLKRRVTSEAGSDIRIVAAARDAFLAAAIAAARKDFIVLLDAGDVVEEDALARLSGFILDRACDVAYGDERQVCKPSGGKAVLKPGWSPDLLTAYNYFGRLTAIRRSVALGALPSAAAGAAAEWDLNLRVAERTRAIAHLPEILCRRAGDDAWDRRLPEGDAGHHVEVLEACWRRRGREARVTRAPDGTFRASWALPERPLVSVIIPNKDRSHLLRVCADGLYHKTAYDNFELIIVDNGSAEPETLELYDELREKAARIVPFDEAFNYSRACNLGAAEARGEFLLFLNNDIEVIQPDWLDELVRQASEPGIGVVGAKLLYPDGGIQHAGVVLGLFTLAAHVFHRAPENHWGPIGTPNTTRNCIAVTGACQLMRRERFDLVGGYDERFRISYSDVALCMDIARAGFRTVYVPSAVLVHHEGASRGYTNPSSDQILFARHIRSCGLAADPFFHPGLDTGSFVPVLRKAPAAGGGPTPIQVDVDRLAGQAGGALDIFDDGAVATAAGIPWGEVNWPFDPLHMEPGWRAGARIVLEFIRRRRDLRALFPTALRDGAQGGFALWVKTEGLRLLGLPPEHRAWIDAAFEADLGASARQILVFDRSLRQEVPLFLLPGGAGEACRVLFAALGGGTVTLESIWWFLVANAQDAQIALCETWAMTPSWQEAVPDGGTVFGVAKLAEWVAETHGCSDDGIFAQTYPTIMSDADQIRVAYAARPDWRARFPGAMEDEDSAQALLEHLASRACDLHFLPRSWLSERLDRGLAREIVQPGVNILGHFACLSGLRSSSESIAKGLALNGVACSLRDVPVSLPTDQAIGHRFQGLEVHDTTIIHVQPEPLFLRAFPLAGLRPRKEATYRIGYWYGEFDEIPASWDRMALQCDELWAPTEFVASRLRKRCRQPVHVMRPGIEIEPFEPLPRSAFGLGDEFVFVFAFPMTSGMERKNPLGLIEAFKKAFAGEARARLVVKTSFGEEHPASLALLEAAAEGANVTVIDGTFSRRETLSLIAAGDAYVSLHRGEGLGFTMAEAMLLGRPVVATRFSGNLDFMDDDNSLLVDCRLVPPQDGIPSFEAGLHWAEPSVAHAARQMRRLFDDPAFARELGGRARRDLERRFGYRAAGEAMARRLAEIARLRGPRKTRPDPGAATGGGAAD